jgi:tetratricopeptide (TPR) repeat protein
MAEIDAVLERHPDFIMGHLFKAGWFTQAMETRVYWPMVDAWRAAEELSAVANERELGHLAAVERWIAGEFHSAVQIWEELLTRWPRDLFALQLAHLSHVLLGDTVGQRDTVARVLPLWDESVPGYEHVLAFHAFGLEENADFTRAEETARHALAMRPDHPYAIHAVAHVMEMQGRQQGGIRFMMAREKDWAESNFANHLWWHTALFHLDLGRHDRVLEIYDANLRAHSRDGDRYEELDATALLWRLRLIGMDTGDRYRELAEKWAPSASDTLYAFNDVHAMMAFVSAGHADAQAALLNANERNMETAGDANVAMSREIGIPFCLAVQDFHEGRYGDCVDRLLPVRYRNHRLGGSAAQRDVIGWTLLEAALRAGRFNLALALANERCALKPTSPQNWLMVARAFQGRGDLSAAARARARADALAEG